MEIIDNFLSQEDYLELKNTVESLIFPWYYVKNVSAPPGYDHGISDPNVKETDGFFHNIFDKYNYGNVKPSIELFDKFFIALESIGYSSEDLLVLRLSMKLPKEGYTEETYQIPHVDLHDNPHDTLIYYINDSDGSTKIFDQKYTGERITEFTIKDRVKPVGNRLLLIDGWQYHTATSPINSSRRIVVNLNLRKRESK